MLAAAPRGGRRLDEAADASGKAQLAPALREGARPHKVGASLRAGLTLPAHSPLASPARSPTGSRRGSEDLSNVVREVMRWPIVRGQLRDGAEPQRVLEEVLRMRPALAGPVPRDGRPPLVPSQAPGAATSSSTASAIPAPAAPTGAAAAVPRAPAQPTPAAGLALPLVARSGAPSPADGLDDDADSERAVRMAPSLAQHRFLDERAAGPFEPPARDVRAFAEVLGIDLALDDDLLWIAREALVNPLPPGWRAAMRFGCVYFVNLDTGAVQFEDPCEEYYRALYARERRAKRSRVLRPVTNTPRQRPLSVWDLHGAAVDDAAVESVARNLTATVTELVLGEALLSDAGLERLVRCLETNKTLTRLSLSGCVHFSHSGFELLGQLLEVNGALAHLDVSYCGIDDAGAESLAIGLMSNRALRVLDLTGNSVGDKGARSLREALDCCCVEELALGENPVPSATLRELAIDSALATNRARNAAGVAPVRVAAARERTRRRGLEAETPLTASEPISPADEWIDAASEPHSASLAPRRLSLLAQSQAQVAPLPRRASSEESLVSDAASLSLAPSARDSLGAASLASGEGSPPISKAPLQPPAAAAAVAPAPASAAQSAPDNEAPTRLTQPLSDDGAGPGIGAVTEEAASVAASAVGATLAAAGSGAADGAAHGMAIVMEETEDTASNPEARASPAARALPARLGSGVLPRASGSASLSSTTSPGPSPALAGLAVLGSRFEPASSPLVDAEREGGRMRGAAEEGAQQPHFDSAHSSPPQHVDAVAAVAANAAGAGVGAAQPEADLRPQREGEPSPPEPFARVSAPRGNGGSGGARERERERERGRLPLDDIRVAKESMLQRREQREQQRLAQKRELDARLEEELARKAAEEERRSEERAQRTQERRRRLSLHRERRRRELDQSLVAEDATETARWLAVGDDADADAASAGVGSLSVTSETPHRAAPVEPSSAAPQRSEPPSLRLSHSQPTSLSVANSPRDAPLLARTRNHALWYGFGRPASQVRAQPQPLSVAGAAQADISHHEAIRRLAEDKRRKEERLRARVKKLILRYRAAKRAKLERLAQQRAQRAQAAVASLLTSRQPSAMPAAASAAAHAAVAAAAGISGDFTRPHLADAGGAGARHVRQHHHHHHHPLPPQPPLHSQPLAAATSSASYAARPPIAVSHGLARESAIDAERVSDLAEPLVQVQRAAAEVPADRNEARAEEESAQDPAIAEQERLEPQPLFRLSQHESQQHRKQQQEQEELQEHQQQQQEQQQQQDPELAQQMRTQPPETQHLQAPGPAEADDDDEVSPAVTLVVEPSVAQLPSRHPRSAARGPAALPATTPATPGGLPPRQPGAKRGPGGHRRVSSGSIMPTTPSGRGSGAAVGNWSDGVDTPPPAQLISASFSPSEPLSPYLSTEPESATATPSVAATPAESMTPMDTARGGDESKKGSSPAPPLHRSLSSTDAAQLLRERRRAERAAKARGSAATPAESKSVAASRRRDGDRIHWQRGELIGRGSFAKVYMGMNVRTGQLLAVKQVRMSTEEERKHCQAIESEISIMKGLKHQHVVELLGVEKTASKLSILMEYVPGNSLDTVLHQFGPLNEAVIRNYVRQLLMALEYCHAHNVVHRDIKSKNVLVDTVGNVKLGDFGSAKRFDDMAVKAAPSVNFNYTPLWTAPEVLGPVGEYDRKVDIWSLGCVVIEMATAAPPWAEMNFENPFRALFHIGNSKAIPRIPDSLSELAQDFLRLCLQRDPALRPDAQELLAHPWVQDMPVIPELESALSAESASVSQDSRAVSPEREAPPTATTTAAAAAAAAAAHAVTDASSPKRAVFADAQGKAEGPSSPSFFSRLASSPRAAAPRSLANDVRPRSADPENSARVPLVLPPRPPSAPRDQTPPL